MAEPSRARRLAAKVRARHRSSLDCSGCGGHFTSKLKWNSHRCIEMAGLWSSRAARAAGRSMGKAQDAARRAAVKARIAAGLTEVRTRTVTRTDKKGKTREFTERYAARTDRARTRPEVRGRVRARDVRAVQKHHDGHQRGDRNDGHATRHESLADGHAALTAAHVSEGHRLRGRVHQTQSGFHRGLAGIRGQRAEHHHDRADSRAARTR
jgi:hypothetical protein